MVDIVTEAIGGRKSSNKDVLNYDYTAHLPNINLGADELCVEDIVAMFSNRGSIGIILE